MAGFRAKIGIAALAGAALAAVVVPAFGAGGNLLRMRQDNPVSLGELGTIYSFTPSIQDSRLSAAYAHAASLNRTNRSFRFTPTSGSMSGSREITILVRADRLRNAGGQLGIAPLAFSLDASRAWRKMAEPESVGRKPLDPVATDLSPLRNFSLDRDSSRLRANMQLDARRELGTAPQTLAGEPKYSVDVASSYSLTRNLNVTAGIRYAGPDNRLAPLTDQRQDSQAVYVGTSFKF